MTAADITITTAHGVVPAAVTYLGVVSAPHYNPHPERFGSSTDPLKGLNEFDPAPNVELLRERAAALGADAVIGVQFTVSVLPGGVYTVATGTAIRSK